MKTTTLMVPAVHTRRTTIADATALLDLAARVACVTITLLDQFDRGAPVPTLELLTRLRRHPDVVALRRYLDASHPS